MMVVRMGYKDDSPRFKRPRVANRVRRTEGKKKIEHKLALTEKGLLERILRN